MSINDNDDAFQDEQLVLKAKKGDYEAMNALILKYQDFVLNIAYRHLNHYEEARECSQEVFLSAFKGIGGFQQRSSFKTWLYRIAVNRAIYEYHRKKKKHSVLYLRESGDPSENDKELDIPDTSSIPYNELDKKERAEMLNRAIESIKEIYRVPLVLRDIQGLTYEEIGGILEIDPGTVKSRISRGRECLHSLLFKRDEFNE